MGLETEPQRCIRKTGSWAYRAVESRAVQELKRIVNRFERPSLFDMGLIFCLLALTGVALQLV